MNPPRYASPQKLRRGDQMTFDEVVDAITRLRDGTPLALWGEAEDGTEEFIEISHLPNGDKFRWHQSTHPADSNSPTGQTESTVSAERLCQMLLKFPDPWWLV
jgi:hypothetical protein